MNLREMTLLVLFFTYIIQKKITPVKGDETDIFSANFEEAKKRTQVCYHIKMKTETILKRRYFR